MSARLTLGLRFATLLLILLGAWRLLSLVTHEPINGYANQFDMARTSACLDLWPAASMNASDSDLVAATAAAPLAQYQIRALPEQPCYYSSEAAFDRVVLWLSALISDAPVLDLRVIGQSKAWALLLSTLACTALLWRFPVAGLVHAGIVSAVLCDPLISLYANSLYTEFSAAWGAYLFLAGFAAYALSRGRSQGGLRASACAAVLGLLMLSCSRVPNAAVAVVLCLLALIFLWRWRASMLFASGLLLSSASGVFLAINNQHGSETIQRANAANTLLYTFLPASTEPAKLMQRLRLPESCQRYGFSSWYLSRGVEITEPCQVLYQLSRLRMLAALVQEPMMGVRVLANAFAQSRGWRVHYVGEVAGLNYARSAHSSLADLVPRLPYFLYVFGMLLVLAVALMLLTLPLLVLEPQQRSQSAWCCLQSQAALLAALLICPLLISLLGDGYTELPRHAHLSTVVVLPIFLLGLIGVVAMLRDAERLRLVVLTLLGALLAAGLSAFALSRQASALGIWDHVLFAKGPHRIDGSVIDPYGIASAFARASDQPDQPLAISQPGKDVSQVFQGYPASSKIRGVITVHAPFTEIVVKNHRGVETVVDRIWPEPARTNAASPQ